ncbi:MAG: translation initiation factor IF-2 [Proteobacteria bacterium]|nr:translation initiation factor IF-2 [Pseudomonadota bacterium]
MDKNNENKGRSKLTLKLKLPTSSSDPKTLALKSAEKKRINNYSVQVEIKGRKSAANSTQNSESSLNGGLSKSEFETRRKALEKLSGSASQNDDSSESFKDKIKQEILKERELANKRKAEIEAKKAIENHEDPVTEETKETKLEEDHSEKYSVDDFNVLNKIKKSLGDDRQKMEERQKLLAEKERIAKEAAQKAEQERLEKERISKKAKSKKIYTKDGEDDFEDGSKKKPSFKERKANSRRLLKTFIVDNEDGDSGEYRYRKSKNKKPQIQSDHTKISKEITLPELITVSDLAERMSEKTSDVVKKLFTMGVVATSNQSVDADTAELIATEFGHSVRRVLDSDIENILDDQIDENVEQLERAPIVTIMGHVDHGKTSLLDAIRSTDIVAGESGGITQHIGASYIKTNSGKHITFLDTPGHEAFTEMRSRGANATDIVVLVVAADDGVKEQTVEAINHAKAAEVPIIVAVNKIDKPGADPSRVKNELLAHEIVSEDLGGDVMFVEVSAKQKLNLDKLEDAILLQAEVLELKAPYDCKAKGVVIEARVDAAKGVIASILVQSGTLNISDLMVVGTAYGKIKKMSDDHGKNVKKATPAVPVEILGLDSAPNAGDQFSIVTEEKQARNIISYRSKKEKDEKNLKNSVKSLSDIFKEAGANKIKHLPIILKGDVHGSVEAICSSLAKLNTDEVAIKVIHSATGGINESDVSLAAVSGAIIIGFNVRANAAAKELAKDKEIQIRYHSIIYNVVDEMKLLLGGMLEPIKSEEYLGQLEIRQVFKVSGAGKVAGCFVTDGVIKKGAKVRLLRDNVVIHDGTLKTLKRFKEDVKEVKNGFECGSAFENYDDIKEGDIVECYEIVEEKRSLDNGKKS